MHLRLGLARLVGRHFLLPAQLLGQFEILVPLRDHLRLLLVNLLCELHRHVHVLLGHQLLRELLAPRLQLGHLLLLPLDLLGQRRGHHLHGRG